MLRRALLTPPLDAASASRDSWALARWFALRLFGVVMLGVFLSLWHQALALIGFRGLSPVAETLAHNFPS